MQTSRRVLSSLADIAGWQEQLYADLYRNPELSMRERRTGQEVTRHLESFGFAVHHRGGGVAGVLENGPGPTVLVRADMDALPITEATGLPYASTVTTVDSGGATVGVMHACGHDVHVVCGLSAARLLAAQRDAWNGTFVALFQPGEETAEGAQAMVDAGLTEVVPRPDVAFAQHVLTAPPAGHVATAAGSVFSAGDSIKVTVYGKGSHGSMPHLGIDPLVLASSIVTRLQTISSRETAPGDFAVVTIGSLHAGAKSNVIADRAVMLLNVRTYNGRVREAVLSSIERIVRAECVAAGSPEPPTFEYYERFPVTENDHIVTEKVTRAFRDYFGDERVHQLKPTPASEDFSRIPIAFDAPYTYWGLGGFTDENAVVPNHNPGFAPVVQPTLRTGTEAMIVASLAYLADPASGQQKDDVDQTPHA